METIFVPQPALFEYGILNEASDIRAHVGVVCRRVFVFETQAALQAIERHKEEMKLRTVHQHDVVGPTAKGYAVKLEWIEGLVTISPKSWPGWIDFRPDATPSVLGQQAVGLVCWILQRGPFPLFVDCQEDQRHSVQIKGSDIVLYAHKRIQVKCDYRAGPEKLGGTGNLFLQTAERNPKKFH